MSPMVPEYRSTPLVCDNGHAYWDVIEWKIHYVEGLTQPTHQLPEIRTLCQHPDYLSCNATLKVRDGWTPY